MKSPGRPTGSNSQVQRLTAAIADLRFPTNPIKHRTRRVPDVPLGQVRLSHLLEKTPRSEPDKFITVRIPRHVLDAVRQVARRCGTTNAEAVVALLNEGLDAARRRKLI